MQGPATASGAAIERPPTTRITAPASSRTAPAAAFATTVIVPHRGWFDWRLGQLWRYRDLIGMFVWRDFVAVYKQTVLGPLWHVIRPLMTTVIFTVVFGRMARLSTDGVSPFLFYLTGSVAWAYFASCLENISRTFVANAHLIGKVYFHRLVIPTSLVISNLIAFGIQFAVLVGASVVVWLSGGHVALTWWILALPLVVLLLAGYGLGAGVIVAAMTARYRDLAYLVTFGIQLFMYLTPVIYPLSAVPPNYRWLVRLNPLTAVFEAFRKSFLGVGSISLGDLMVACAGMVALVIVGLAVFSRVERTVMDTV